MWLFAIVTIPPSLVLVCVTMRHVVHYQLSTNDYKLFIYTNILIHQYNNIHMLIFSF